MYASRSRRGKIPLTERSLKCYSEGLRGSYPETLALGDEDLFVANGGNSTVTVYAADGTSLLRTISQGISAPRALRRTTKMHALVRSRHAIAVCAGLAILAGCGSGSGSPIGSTGLPAAQSVIPGMPGMRNVVPYTLNGTSVITVKLNGRPLPDAEVKMGWGDRCGFFDCHPWQKTGKTGPMGTKEFKGLPSRPVYFCIEAKKGNSYAASCGGPFLIRPKESIDIK